MMSNCIEEVTYRGPSWVAYFDDGFEVTNQVITGDNLKAAIESFEHQTGHIVTHTRPTQLKDLAPRSKTKMATKTTITPHTGSAPIEWHFIDHKNIHNPTGKIPNPPSVTVNGNSFCLNNLAVALLVQIHGSMNFSIQMAVSKCGRHFAFTPRGTEKRLTSPPKMISSADARRSLACRGRQLGNLVLRRDGDMLIATLTKDDYEPLRGR
ncbi:hypothetical protein AB6D11_18575 [Vibrio splendidus]